MADKIHQTPHVSTDELHDAFEETFFLFSSEGRMLRWNQTLREVTGFSDEEIASMRPVDFLPEEERQLIDELIQTVVREGRAAVEAHVLTKDGQKLPYRFTGVLQHVNGRAIICGRGEPLVSTAPSDSEHPLLTESVKLTLRELPIFLYTMDRDLRYTWASNALPGLDIDDFIGRTPDEVLPESEAKRVQEMRDQVLTTGEPARAEFSATLQGETHIVDSYMVPRRDGAERIVGLVVAAVDVTERKAAEDQFRQLIEAVEEYAIFRLDDTGRITTWNEGARKIKGYERDEIIGQHFSVFYPPEDRASGLPEELLERAARDGYIETQGWRIRKTGDRFWARVTLTALKGENEQPGGYS